MVKKKQPYFTYPPNLNILDLATLVSMYRSRGEPTKAAAGNFLACSQSKKLLREAKSWFGLYYSQTAWDDLLTKNSEGYPLTEVEMNILGMAYYPPETGALRSFVEKNSGTLPQLAFLIVNDLKQFGFIIETATEIIELTKPGLLALEGIANRIHGTRFTPDFLPYIANVDQPTIPKAEKQDKTQINLF